MLFLMYFRLTYYFAQSGLAHMSAQYIEAFFGNRNALNYIREPPSNLQRIISTIVKYMVIFVGVAVFIWGFYWLVIFVLLGEAWHR